MTAHTASGVAERAPWMQQRADALDRDAAFPTEEIDWLRRVGALAMPLPVATSGTNDVLADNLAALLIQVGRGNLAVGRILEAHLNALHLIALYGAAGPWRRAMQDVQAGHLFALWVTDPPTDGLRMFRAGDSIRLGGCKQFCSAAGYATRALVTAVDADGATRMLVLCLDGREQVTPLPSPLQGMRAAVTGAVNFEGCQTSADSCLGGAGDYLREPDFSAGAWRGSAVALGGLIALLDATIEQLRAAGRLRNPHSQARLGQAIIARETARMWLRDAARLAEDPAATPEHRVATVGLARIAIETACLDAMRLAQRSLGLSAFRQGNPVERICRDLSTYLRQPAPDEVLTEAANWFAAHPGASTVRPTVRS